MAFPNPETMDAHRDWLQRMREEYDSLSLSASEGAPSFAPVDAAPEHSAFAATRRPSWAAPAAPAPSYGSQPAHWCDSMATLQLDDAYAYEDAPVYRSLGSTFDDAPVYRGFGGTTPGAMAGGNCFEGMDAMRAAAAAEGPASVDQLWLSKMPPLLSRQRGFHMDLDM